MKKINKNELGFGAVEILLLILIVAVIGFGGYYVYFRNKSSTHSNSTHATSTTPTKTATITPAKTVYPYTGWKLYEVKALGLNFKYPGDWKIVDDSDDLGTFIRVQSPDYQVGESGFGYSGTQITVSQNNSHNTYSADKQSAATKPGSNKDVKDLTVDGKPAFSYSSTLNETGYTVFDVEVDPGSNSAREFLYQSNDKTTQKYDTTNLAVFNKLLNSVNFE